MGSAAAPGRPAHDSCERPVRAAARVRRTRNRLNRGAPWSQQRWRARALGVIAGGGGQVEAFTQFFLGYYNHDMTYQDDLLVSVRRNLSSVTGFWFDAVTSIPWSYMDMHFYLVRAPMVSRTESRSSLTPLLSLSLSLTQSLSLSHYHDY